MPDSLESIVEKTLPGVRVVKTAKPATRGGDLKQGVHKVASLKVMQKKVAEKKGPADAPVKKKLRAPAKGGPSGVAYIAPKNADGLSGRTRSKAVIVSHGKVVAVQG